MKTTLMLCLGLATPVLAQQRSAPNPAPPRSAPVQPRFPVSPSVAAAPEAVGRTFGAAQQQKITIITNAPGIISTNAIFPTPGTTTFPTSGPNPATVPAFTGATPGPTDPATANFPPNPAISPVSPATNLTSVTTNQAAITSNFPPIPGATNVAGAVNANGIAAGTPPAPGTLANQLAPQFYGVGAPVSGEIVQSEAVRFPAQAPAIVTEEIELESARPNFGNTLPVVRPRMARRLRPLPPPITPPPPSPVQRR